MIRLAALALCVLSVLSLPSIIGATAINHSSSARAIAKTQYTKPHSLGDSYVFDSRHGWQSFNASNLHSKSRREPSKDVLNKKPSSGLMGLAQAIGTVINGLQGKGESKPVTITWYTGHDLLNPSCWANTAWAPTDMSFVCALTLEGWQNKFGCFSFIELCHGPTKCVFVRVVDTCAGCAAGTHHVDMTRGSFSQLADPEQGSLTVMARPATNPEEWFEDLWGPKEG
ncbi:hypothetical protein B0H11DRAFT_1968159 [Mycena galericulata]|nr:hypothetical protein B0H11DRAFT_1968159 [Mycena galericulata]